MDKRAFFEVNRLIRELSYREGDFTLASGKKSRFYIDLKATTLHPEGAYWIGEASWEILKSGQFKIDGIGGLTLGADPLATCISLAAWNRDFVWPAFIVRKEAKDHGTSKYVEGTENLPRNANLVVLEDVVTTGGSTLKAVSHLREAGFNPFLALAVVDREEGGAEAIRKAGLQFLSLTTLEKIKSEQ